jgi:2,3-bisphosphoglycerate-dependent phosphoglycerate mutase
MPLYFVRHGQTDWNKAGRFQSTTDVPLNETGLAQARAIRFELVARGVQFSAARCSPLSRAVDTARVILEGSASELVIEPRFMEVSFGDWEGRSETDLAAEFGEAYRVWRESNYTLTPPGGQSIITEAARVRPAVEEMLASALCGEALIVAHQAVMMAMKVALTGRSDVESARDFRQNNEGGVEGRVVGDQLSAVSCQQGYTPVAATIVAVFINSEGQTSKQVRRNCARRYHPSRHELGYLGYSFRTSDLAVVAPWRFRFKASLFGTSLPLPPGSRLVASLRAITREHLTQLASPRCLGWV